SDIMTKTMTTVIAAIATAFATAACGGSEPEGGIHVGTDTANPEKVEDYRRVIAEDMPGFTVQELTPWVQPERDGDGSPYIAKDRLLPDEIAVPSGEKLTADAACVGAGGQVMMSDPPQCTVDIPVADAIPQPEPITDAAPSEGLERMAEILREARTR